MTSIPTPKSLAETDEIQSSPAATKSRIEVGDWVQVLDIQAIMKTLDEDGTVKGMPFMPEMLPFCGRSFRVKRIANKACVNGEYIGSLDDTYVLQTDRRCDGSSHGGCELGCNFFWRKEWLVPREHPVQESQNLTDSSISNQLTVLAQKSLSCYRCQATELVNIASPSSALNPKQYVRDFRSGVSAKQLMTFMFSLLRKKLLRKNESWVGECKGRTPMQKLNLQVGEKVEVRSQQEILKTLDEQGKNRGLWFDPGEMATFCGKEYFVSRVIHRLIDELTGELKVLKQPSIVLSESECTGVYRRFCSRGMLHFWREIWLKRVEPKASDDL